ncbi:unnamed protein product [Schistocephalus solidus]|uniref:Uncharacterized protein n=1 Tax=Schistocephalus solidus TaxID=70667 RepID=A0A183S8I7_SCHSO|nr:unnamed protein product [Schistocephalus solidus]
MGIEGWNVGEDAGAPFHSRTLTPIPTSTVAAYRIATLRSMSASPRLDPAVAHCVALPTGYQTDMTTGTNTTGASTYPFASWLTAERSTPLPDSHSITYVQAVNFAYQLTSATPNRHQSKPHPKPSPPNSASPNQLPPHDAIRAKSPPFTAHFSKLKPYRGRLPACTADSQPILPANQVPPVAIEVTIPHIVQYPQH